MLSKSALTELLKANKYSDADIAEMTGTAEVGLKPNTGISVFSETDLNTLKENVRKGAKEAVLDIHAKELRAKYGIDEDTKDISRIIELHAEKKVKEVGATPDAKVGELETKLKNLQTTIDAKDAEVRTWETKYKDREINDTYRSFLHPDRNPALTDEEWISRLKNGFDIVDENGVLAIKDKATGKVITDNKENARPAKEVMEETFKSKPEWLKPTAATPAAPIARTTLAAGKGTAPNGKGLTPQQITEKIQNELGTLKGSAAMRMYNELLATNMAQIVFML